MGSAEHHTHLPRPSGDELDPRRTCTVKRWRGYRMCTFYAELEGGGVIAESKPFRERGPAGGPSAAAEESHRGLLADLEELGWELTDEGGPAWYASTLQRPPEIWEMTAASPAADTGPPPPETPARAVEQPVRPLARLIPHDAPPGRQAPLEAVPAGTPASGEGAPEPALTRAKPWKKTAGAAVGLAAVAGVASVALVAAGPSRPQAPVPQHAAAGRHAAPAAAAAPTESAVLAQPVVHVTIAAPSRASWLEVRRSSAHGAVLFSGELGPGHRLRFTGSRLWARFGAAGNLSISVDGKRLELQGTYEHVFRARPTSS